MDSKKQSERGFQVAGNCQRRKTPPPPPTRLAGQVEAAKTKKKQTGLLIPPNPGFAKAQKRLNEDCQWTQHTHNTTPHPAGGRGPAAPPTPPPAAPHSTRPCLGGGAGTGARGFEAGVFYWGWGWRLRGGAVPRLCGWRFRGLTVASRFRGLTVWRLPACAREGCLAARIPPSTVVGRRSARGAAALSPKAGGQGVHAHTHTHPPPPHRPPCAAGWPAAPPPAAPSSPAPPRTRQPGAPWSLLGFGGGRGARGRGKVCLG